MTSAFIGGARSPLQNLERCRTILLQVLGHTIQEQRSDKLLLDPPSDGEILRRRLGVTQQLGNSDPLAHKNDLPVSTDYRKLAQKNVSFVQQPVRVVPQVFHALDRIETRRAGLA
jgi:hypothetical protein